MIFNPEHWKLFTAILTIMIADLTMSTDNILAIGAVAKDDFWLMAFGLTFSMMLMGFAANFISTLLERYKWIGYLGFVVIFLLALKMTMNAGLKLLA